ncbi:MauE/DoxX family redox-associated membrane protein [Actinomadura parmotrematis]|uniref:Methylamine utilisation protein MauE domain-containing protein n=1 Tax=Actinomadura parmotrematis TaxID=2864039 RepID=A0ABS7FP87_9ACTN|nr:MauE/DoxX family redox-associated membrane protein [Actinomadura parmotrematis]MBW8482182.1 hypothetical protein [Actinomadura parmotrematis]
MTVLAAGAAAVAVPLALLVSLAGQARRPSALPDALRAHRVLPRAAPVPVLAAALAVLTEAGAAAVALAGLAGRWDAAFRAGLGGAAALLAVYAAYSAYVARARGGRVPCGCAGSTTPMTGWVAARAAGLALLALGGALAGLPDGAPLAHTAVAAVAGLALAVLLGTLPHALADPAAPGAAERSPAR